MSSLTLRCVLPAVAFALAMSASARSGAELNPPPEQSIGHPRSGALHEGVAMPRGPRHVLRNPQNVFGTTATVAHLLAVLDALDAVPHRLVVGDLSGPRGGRLPHHQSHQTGRDVDLGLFHTREPGRRFVEATPANFEPAATWALLVALAETADEPGGVEWILLDYEVQGWLYAWARGADVDPGIVDAMLQYPHGPRSDHGLVRHRSNHHHHLHVRFACPTSSARCHSPVGPPR